MDKLSKPKKTKEGKPRYDKYESTIVAVKGTIEDVIKASLKPKPNK